MSNNVNYSNFIIRLASILLFLVATLWAISHILDLNWNWGFTEPSIVLFILNRNSPPATPTLGGIQFAWRCRLQTTHNCRGNTRD